MAERRKRERAIKTLRDRITELEASHRRSRSARARAGSDDGGAGVLWESRDLEASSSMSTRR